MHKYTDMQLELIRKFFHVLIGILIVLGFNAQILNVEIFALIVILLTAAILYNLKAEHELLTKILSVNRADAQIPGIEILFYFIGCLITLSIFPIHIASAAIMILAFGDAIAHLAAKSFNNTFMSAITYKEGTLFGIIAGALSAWLYVPLIAAIIAATCAMIIEAGELRIAEHRIDDNLLIPLVAASTLWLLNWAFPALLI